MNAAGTGGAQQGAENRGKHVRMLVRVDVGDAQSTGLQALDLGGRFRFDLAKDRAFSSGPAGIDIAEKTNE
jgi:hypothetical protein